MNVITLPAVVFEIGVMSTLFNVTDTVTFSGLINSSVSLNNLTVNVMLSPTVAISGLSTLMLVPIKLMF